MQRGSKTQNGRFPSKISFEESLLQVSLCEYYRQQSCTAFTGLYNRAKMVDRDVPFYLKFRPKLTFKKVDFQLIFARSASAVTLSEKVQFTRIGIPLMAFQ